MKRKRFIFVATMTLLLCMTACGKNKDVIAQEDYYYAAILHDMIQYPDKYWEQWEDRNIPENNQFAIIDINSDGTKELLVQYDDHWVPSSEEFKSIDIYWYRDVIDTISYVTPEFYKDGTILEKTSGNFGEAGWDIYKNGEPVLRMSILDKSKPAYYFDDDFPTDKDTDGDGIVYAWHGYENGYPTEEQYVTKAEYHAKMNETIRGTEKLEIAWHGITGENIVKAINPALSNEDISIFHATADAEACLYEKSCLVGPESEDEEKLFEVVPLMTDRQNETLLIYGICNRSVDENVRYSYSFGCALQENADTPMNGYTVVDTIMNQIMSKE